jgi:hypothetical protein
MEDELKGTIWRHYKGGVYVVLGIAKHSEKDEDLVIYKNCETSKPTVWARPANTTMQTGFFDQAVDAGKPRFTRMTNDEYSDWALTGIKPYVKTTD